MTDIDKFHEWVESQSPLALREYIHAQAAWQARGEFDAVKIKGLLGYIKMMDAQLIRHGVTYKLDGISISEALKELDK